MLYVLSTDSQIQLIEDNQFSSFLRKPETVSWLDLNTDEAIKPNVIRHRGKICLNECQPEAKAVRLYSFHGQPLLKPSWLWSGYKVKARWAEINSFNDF